MTQLRAMRREDRPEPGADAAGPPDLSPLLGTWHNTDAATGHIARLTLRRNGERVTVQAYGADDSAVIDWGEVDVEAFVTGVTRQEGVGFCTVYDFGFMETKMVSNHSKGILVIQTYNSFKDGSGRANYFSREFFHR